MKRIFTHTAVFAAVAAVGLGSAGSAMAKHGADDPAGHKRHGADDVQPHHKHAADDARGHKRHHHNRNHR